MMEWYERRPTDYKEDTWHLTLAEHGAYNLLLDHYYSSENPLPNTDRALASICNCSVDEWLVVKDAVLLFFKKRGAKYVSKKCEQVLKKAYRIRKDGAKRTAKSRENKGLVTRDSHVGNAPTIQDNTLHNTTKKNSNEDVFLEGLLKTETYESAVEIAPGRNIDEIEKRWRIFMKDKTANDLDASFLGFVKKHIEINRNRV